MKKLTALIPILLLLNYKQKGVNSSSSVKLNQIAAKYVTLGLTIGEYDSDFVITYYGPDSLKPHHAKAEFFPKDSLLKQVNDLQDSIKLLKCRQTVT